MLLVFYLQTQIVELFIFPIAYKRNTQNLLIMLIGRIEKLWCIPEIHFSLSLLYQN